MDRQYVNLYYSGELKRRSDALWGMLKSCTVCPKDCRVNRLEGKLGYCLAGSDPIVSSAVPHFGEEPALTGTRGVGNIFFGNCNLRCVYCQNWQISQRWKEQRGNRMSCEELGRLMVRLQERGVHSIGFVSPTHFAPQIVRALLTAVPLGLRLPLIYNTGGYDSGEVLRLLDGVIDIYLPDMKYSRDDFAEKLSVAKNYVEVSRAAVAEMYRQVGNLRMDENGVAERGLIIRHLILPNGLAGTRETFRWIAENLSREVTISLMSQYFPANKAWNVPPLNRPITTAEYEEAVRLLHEFGLENGWVQELESNRYYRPDFDSAKPFDPEIDSMVS